MPQESKPQTTKTETLGSASRPDVHNHDNGVSRETSTTYEGAGKRIDNPFPGMTVTIQRTTAGTWANFTNGHRTSNAWMQAEGDDRQCLNLALALANTGDDPGTLLAYITSPERLLREEAKKHIRELKKIGRKIYEYAQYIDRTTSAL